MSMNPAKPTRAHQGPPTPRRRSRGKRVLHTFETRSVAIIAAWAMAISGTLSTRPGVMAPPDQATSTLAVAARLVCNEIGPLRS